MIVVREVQGVNIANDKFLEKQNSFEYIKNISFWGLAKNVSKQHKIHFSKSTISPKM